MDLSERKRRILCAIVELYNKTGEPVGSKRLLELLPDGVSSATIRNEMAQLTELGFLEQPHTSAGRAPAPLAYRFYIDQLQPGRGLPLAQQRNLEALLRERAREPERLLENAGRLLAELTDCTALCVAHGGADAKLRRLEMAPVGRYMAMVALLSDRGTVKSRIIRTDSELTETICSRFAQLTQEALVGLPLRELNRAAMQTLAARAGEQMLPLMGLLAAVAELAHEAAEQELLVGDSAGLRQQELEQSAALLLRQLLESGKRQPGGIGIALGAEAPQPSPALRDMTLLVSPYSIGGAACGLLGVLGSLRLDYANVIPSLRFVSDLVSGLLEQGLEEE
ncbi:MAG: heat-inducible transcriptional repressor HrcA [Oscillospiraceae bacterium]|nr:heat-inducible transcriptional repressor HrcA [Oscillospiraceae bacterium]